MVSKLRQLGIVFVFAASLGCILGGSTVSTTSLSTGVGTSGFDEGFDEGLDEGGLLGGCGQYLQACEEDPYCACFLECAVETESFDACLAKCNLAQIPYWAQQFILCIESELGEIPDPDSGQEGRSE